ncbi:MAG: hypothetical protein V8Q75_03455 [Bacilli bacterium]
MNNEIENLKRQIKIKNGYLQMILDLGFDYDGFNNVLDLKLLINELCNYAHKALKNDDKSVIYENGFNEKLNILSEKIGDGTSGNSN